LEIDICPLEISSDNSGEFETTQEFQKLFASADVILSKGQGNFETLLPCADKRLFFLLRIKCEHMAALSKVKKDNLGLMQGDKDDKTFCG
jgi:uncharacterized protein with ATP-grasp and redox domains